MVFRARLAVLRYAGRELRAAARQGERRALERVCRTYCTVARLIACQEFTKVRASYPQTKDKSQLDDLPYSVKRARNILLGEAYSYSVSLRSMNADEKDSRSFGTSTTVRCSVRAHLLRPQWMLSDIRPSSAQVNHEDDIGSQIKDHSHVGECVQILWRVQSRKKEGNIYLWLDSSSTDYGV